METSNTIRQTCVICGSLVESGGQLHTTYWNAVKMPICPTHTADERRDYQKAEAYECQIIDADCNDCKHFKRGCRVLRRGDTVRSPEGDYCRIVVAHDVFHGHCTKFDRATIACVNMATGHSCFEHRRNV